MKKHDHEYINLKSFPKKRVKKLFQSSLIPPSSREERRWRKEVALNRKTELATTYRRTDYSELSFCTAAAEPYNSVHPKLTQI